MYLKDLAKFIYTEGTASENTRITVKTHGGDKRVLWTGKAKELQEMKNIDNWIVVEVLIDETDDTSNIDYNKGKIITVI